MSLPSVARHSRRAIALALALGMAASAVPQQADAQGFRILRDAEIESHIRAWSDPVIVAAGLDPDAVSLHLLGSPAINAFVVGGQKVFVNTGTIVKARSPDALMGVIAHEVGHIAAGHLVRMREAAQDATIAGLASSLLAIGATALGGGNIGEAAGAGLSLGGNIAQRKFLQYTRANEHAADTAALRYLAAVGRPAAPMVDLFAQLLGTEQLQEDIDPYRRSHPLTAERIRQIRDQVERTGDISPPPRPEERIAYARMVAKIIAFTQRPERTFQIYGKGTDVASRYARAIGHYKKPDLASALVEIDGLIADQPDDPYFHELRGQMLLENGRAGEAAESYRRAADLAPEAPLILVGLATAETETGDPAVLEGTIVQLERAIALDPHNASAWRLLSFARGRSGKVALADLAQAEYALLQRRRPEAKLFADRALENLPAGSPAAQRARDISELVDKDR